MPAELTIVCLDVGLLAMIVGRAVQARRAPFVQLCAAARSADARTRCAAVRVMGANGLRRYAAILLERVGVESDLDVLVALLEVVQRNSWEPADHPMIVSLRLWAADWSTR